MSRIERIEQRIKEWILAYPLRSRAMLAALFLTTYTVGGFIMFFSTYIAAKEWSIVVTQFILVFGYCLSCVGYGIASVLLPQRFMLWAVIVMMCVGAWFLHPTLTDMWQYNTNPNVNYLIG